MPLHQQTRLAGPFIHLRKDLISSISHTISSNSNSNSKILVTQAELQLLKGIGRFWNSRYLITMTVKLSPSIIKSYSSDSKCHRYSNSRHLPLDMFMDRHSVLTTFTNSMKISLLTISLAGLAKVVVGHRCVTNLEMW